MDANIPSELTGPLPRPVQLTGSGVYCAILAAAFLTFSVAAALWGGINAVQQVQQKAAMRGDSSIASGQVTRLRKGKNSAFVYYTFSVNESSFTGKAELPWELEDVVSGSNRLPVRYVTANPEANHPAAWEWSFFFWYPLSTDLIHLPGFSSESEWLFGALISGPVGVIFFLALRSERKLLAEGMPADGVVTKCTRGSRGSFSVRYEFRTKDGSMANGRSGGDHKEVGASLWVLYLPEDPRRSQMYPTANYRVTE